MVAQLKAKLLFVLIGRLFNQIVENGIARVRVQVSNFTATVGFGHAIFVYTVHGDIGLETGAHTDPVFEIHCGAVAYFNVSPQIRIAHVLVEIHI